MKPQYLYRWINQHGLVRAAMQAGIRKGDLFARVNGGPEGVTDPYPLFEEMRAAGVFHSAPRMKYTLDYGLCREILRHKDFGVGMPAALSPSGRIARFMGRLPLPPNPVDPPSMLVMDPPAHSRLRKPVTSAFTPRAVGRLRDRIAAVTEDLLDELAARRSVDLVAEYASLLPVAIISEMLGVPDDDRDRFLAWGDAISPLLDIGIPWRTHQVAMRSAEQTNKYLLAHLERLRRDPGDNILSHLVTESDLSTTELLASANLLMGAGFETTVNLIGKGIVLLLEHPDQLARLRAEPDLWPNAVEEILRFDPPVQHTGRIALADVEVGGYHLSRGTTVGILLAAANRDPEVFTDPATFDITRANAKDHLSFSSGIHVCLGASLARMEGQYALRALFDRFPDLHLTRPPVRRNQHTLHGFEHIPADVGTQRAHTPEKPVVTA